MSGPTLTVAGCILSFAMLFGIYMSLRGDFMLKMREEPDDADEEDGEDAR